MLSRFVSEDGQVPADQLGKLLRCLGLNPTQAQVAGLLDSLGGHDQLDPEQVRNIQSDIRLRLQLLLLPGRWSRPPPALSRAVRWAEREPTSCWRRSRPSTPASPAPSPSATSPTCSPRSAVRPVESVRKLISLQTGEPLSEAEATEALGLVEAGEDGLVDYRCLVRAISTA